MRRIVIAVFSTCWMAACAAAEPPPPAPEPAAADTAATVESEPEIPLAERWRAPFAVQSRGSVAARGPRVHVVHAGAPPAGAGAAEAEPAPAARADTATREAVAAARPDARAAAPAPAAAPATPAASRGSASGTHRVAAGETFYGIALRYGLSFSQLQAANPGIEPDRIRTGQELRVPRSGGGSAAPRAAARRTHTVASGETLWGIARRYGVPAERIRAANSLEGDGVRVGQTLVIPSAG